MDDMERGDQRRMRQKRMKGWASVMPASAMWPIAAAFLAGVFFLTGRIYRISYLRHFHLEPSLFPDDLSARAVYAVAGWANVYGFFTEATSGYWSGHMVLSILGPTLALLAFAFILAVWRTLVRFVPLYASRMSSPLWLSRPARGVGRWLLSMLRWLFPNEAAWHSVEIARRFIVGALGTYLVILALGLLLVLSLRPFQLAGERVAARSASSMFVDSAVVRLWEGGKERSYRLMECGPTYCALFGDGHAVVVPMSEVKRLDGPAP